MVITKEMEEEEKHLVEEGEKKEREMMEEVNRYINNLIYIDMIPHLWKTWKCKENLQIDHEKVHDLVVQLQNVIVFMCATAIPIKWYFVLIH